VRTAFSALTRARTALLDLQNPDGGWGPRRDSPSFTETTSLAVLALPESVEASERGRGWLRARQRPDGAWPVSEAVAGPSWMTSLAVLALTGSATDSARARRGAAWLLQLEGRGYPLLARAFLLLFPRRRVVALNPDLKGWPWVPGTFSWVEPTAYAMLALKRMRDALPPEPLRERLDQGRRMLLDRACPGGGWNYGNSEVLGDVLWPYPDTTAWALLALQGGGARPVEVQEALSALARMIERNRSGLARSLAILALGAYGVDVERYRERLAERLSQVEAFGDVRALALAATALDSTRHPFQLPVSDAA